MPDGRAPLLPGAGRSPPRALEPAWCATTATISSKMASRNEAKQVGQEQALRMTVTSSTRLQSLRRVAENIRDHILRGLVGPIVRS